LRTERRFARVRDNLGRTTKTIEAYGDGTPDSASDQTNVRAAKTICVPPS